MTSDTEAKSPYLFPLKKNGAVWPYEYNPQEKNNWPTLNTLFRENKTAMPFMMIAPEFQLESLYFLACQEHGIPAPVGNVYNLPLCREIIKTIEPDLLISNETILEPLLSHLTAGEVPITFSDVFIFSWDQPQISPIIREKYPNLTIHTASHPFL